MSLKGLPKNTDVTPLLVTLAQLLKPHTYVELGVKYGYTFNQMIPFVGRAVGVDIKRYGCVKTSDNVEFYNMATDDFAEVWTDEIDLLFIDACHEKTQVLKDFDNFFKFVRPFTGLICLHDTYPIRKEFIDPGYCGTAWEAAHDIRLLYGYARTCEIVTIPGPWFGMSIIRKVAENSHLECLK